MIKITELLDVTKVDIQKAFLLWMIYAWPIYTKDKNYIFAYSNYKKWTDNINYFNYDLFEYSIKHKDKLQVFLWNKYSVEINNIIKRDYKKFDKVFWSEWVSVIFKNNIDNNIYSVIEKWLIDIEDDFKQRFLRWVMESRWSLDFKWNFYTIDIAKKWDDKLVRRKLNRLNDIIWMIYNFNPRVLQEKSNKKNDQFRINMKYYAGHYWFFRPHIIDYYENKNNKKLNSKDWYLFFDNDYISKKISKWTKNFEVNDFAISLIWLSKEEKLEKIRNYKIDNFDFDSEDEIIYSSYNTKEKAKENAWYLCEFDLSHITFLSKSSWKNYVEAHHLIPFSERKNFDISIDVEENLISLCPNCHRKIHLSIDEEKINLIRPLLKKRIYKLKEVWINIDENKIFKFYNIKI